MIVQTPDYDLIFPELDKPIGIKCNTCNRTSYNSNDVNYKYCGYCHKFHKTTRGKYDEHNQPR